MTPSPHDLVCVGRATLLGVPLLLMLVACASPDGGNGLGESVDAPRERWLQEGLPEAVGSEVYALKPPEFLDALSQAEGHWVTLWHDAPDGWLDPAHVPALLERVERSGPCPHVVSARSSVLPFDEGPSTEGAIALYLIAAYRAGRFPIGLGSAADRPGSDDEPWNAASARAWWAEAQ